MLANPLSAVTGELEEGDSASTARSKNDRSAGGHTTRGVDVVDVEEAPATSVDSWRASDSTRCTLPELGRSVVRDDDGDDDDDGRRGPGPMGDG